MNYLAHFHLAGGEHIADDEGLIIGALLGDFVKGPLRGNYPASWENGIRLHRRIDATTDQHPEVQHLLRQFHGDYRRFAGIMLDVCFDYCLSQHWPLFHSQPLPEFADDIYRQLLATRPTLPDDACRQAQRLSEYDVLSAMQQWQTVEDMLARIGTRLSRDNPLDRCSPLLLDLLADIETAFFKLYPGLMDQVSGETWRPDTG